jgi:hypothetical protein
MGRHATHRVDANQKELVRLLRKLPGVGVLVWNGDVDIIVGYRGRNYLLEVKNPTRPKAHDKKSKIQQDLRRYWPGNYAVVESFEDALEVINGRT